MKVVQLDLPLPPTANVIWRTTRTGRTYLNPKYTAWRKAALVSMWTQKPAGGFPFFDGAFEAHIAVALKMQGDIDNRVKPLFGFLATANIIANDKHAQKASISRSVDVRPGYVRVHVYEGPAPDLFLSLHKQEARA